MDLFAHYSKVDVGPTTHQAVLWNQLWHGMREPRRSLAMKSIFDRPPSKLIVTELSKNFCKKQRRRRERSIFCSSTQFVAASPYYKSAVTLPPYISKLKSEKKKFNLGAQLFTLLKAVLCQDINGGFCI